MKWHASFPEQATQKSRDFGRNDGQKRKMDRREFVVMIQEVTVKNFQLTVQRTQVNKIQ